LFTFNVWNSSLIGLHRVQVHPWCDMEQRGAYTHTMQRELLALTGPAICVVFLPILLHKCTSETLDGSTMCCWIIWNLTLCITTFLAAMQTDCGAKSFRSILHLLWVPQLASK